MNYAEARLVSHVEDERMRLVEQLPLQGPERIKGAYAYQTLLQASPIGALPLGSDFPVENINPLYGFYAAVARLDVQGNSPHGPGGWLVVVLS